MAEKFSRRDLLKMLGASATGLALANCAPPPAPQEAEEEGSEAEEAAPEPASEEEVTLQWAMYGYEPWLLFLEDMHGRYKEEVKPNVTVELVTAPWSDFWPKLEAMAAAGTPVDISICEPQYFLPWWERDLLLDLSPLAEDQDPEKFFPMVSCSCLYNESTQFLGCESGGGVMPAWPGNGTCHVMYMNLSLVEEAGLEYPDEDWDWEDFREFAIMLTRDSSGKHPGESGFDKDDIQQYGTDAGFGFGDRKVMKDWIWHAGGRRWSDDQTECMIADPKALEAINYMYDLAIDMGTSPAPGGFEGIAQPFLTGKIAMHITGSWNVDTWATELTDFDWDICRIPVGPGGQDSRYCHTGWGNQLCIFKDSAYLDEAREIFKWSLMTKEGTSYFGREGIPVVRDAVDEEWLNRPDGAHLPEHRELQIVCMEEENGNNTIEPRGPKDQGLIEVMETGMDELRLARITPEEFVQACCEGFEEVWAEEY